MSFEFGLDEYGLVKKPSLSSKQQSWVLNASESK